ncbi:hypothetical protein AB0C71_27290 [Streptomyces anulatus]|uniref:hypothetical protein n=1 Tax=Streptomyces anulatus TaxID=1892 RepID=UPI0033D0C7D5
MNRMGVRPRPFTGVLQAVIGVVCLGQIQHLHLHLHLHLDAVAVVQREAVHASTLLGRGGTGVPAGSTR